MTKPSEDESKQESKKKIKNKFNKNEESPIVEMDEDEDVQDIEEKGIPQSNKIDRQSTFEKLRKRIRKDLNT